VDCNRTNRSARRRDHRLRRACPLFLLYAGLDLHVALAKGLLIGS
jgi:hypothetical protein